MIFVLRDSSSNDVDAIILTHTTSKEDIEDIVEEVKDKWEEDDDADSLLELIEKALPDDCEVYAAWSMDFNTVWYQKGGRMRLK